MTDEKSESGAPLGADEKPEKEPACKQLCEFSQDGEGADFRLQVMVFCIPDGEMPTIRAELDAVNCRYTHIEADALKGNIIGTYPDVMAVLAKLEAAGWKW